MKLKGGFMKETNELYSENFIEYNQNFWVDCYPESISKEEAIEIANNVVGFFGELLKVGETEEMMNFGDANWIMALAGIGSVKEEVN
jgi:hypothetical protein